MLVRETQSDRRIICFHVCGIWWGRVRCRGTPLDTSWLFLRPYINDRRFRFLASGSHVGVGHGKLSNE
ncbi:hypothetical protein L484_015166 [Morus notabilis]|uniref:Uncharacterized protein n=1 Tax=Morus notabilis TaxID=981085 RepID=W9SS20_9ROSA|nr:hypothetical protein L484_015166 [Morus notabilis]